MLDGAVTNVIEEHIGTDLDGDVSAGATTITPTDIDVFKIEGGTAQIGDPDDGPNEPITYTVDVDADGEPIGTLTVPALSNSYTADDSTPIILTENGNLLVERYAYFYSDTQDEEQRALIPTGMYDRLPLDTRDDSASEWVISDYNFEGQLVLQDIDAREPEIDGSFTIPGTQPQGDGVPPGNSPTPTVSGGLGALVVKWDAIDSFSTVTYEVHVSTASGFTPDDTTLAQEVKGTLAWIRTLPDGAELDYETTYYVVIVAKNADGSAEASDEASGSPQQVNSPDIAANAILAEHILAGEITADKLAAILIISSAIKTADSGQRVELDTDGIRWYDSNGNLGIVFPTQTGQPAIIDANIVAAALDMTGPANFRDPGNTLDVGSALALESTLTNPGVAPSVGVSFEQLKLTGGDAAQVVGTGLFYTTTGGAAGTSTTFYASQDTPAGSVLEEYGATFGVLARTLFTAPAGETIYGAVQASVSGTLKIFVLTGVVVFGVFVPKLYRLDNATLAQEVTHALVGNTGFASGGTFANDSSVGSVAWSSPSSAVASDNVWAKAVGAGSSSASTPYRSPGAAVNDATVGTQAWGTPEGVLTFGGTSAAKQGDSPAVVTNYLKTTGYGFSVPPTATITGVTVQIRRTADSGLSAIDNVVRLVRGGSVVGTNQALGGSWPTSLTYQAYGGATDLWGTALTPSDVNATDFGVVLSATVGTVLQLAQVDHIEIKVFYTTPTSQTTQFLKATNFGFSVPANATITGVSAQIERHAPGDITDNTVKLVKGGAVSGDDEALATTWPATDAIATYGGSTDLWGLALTPSDVNASNFGIVVSATGTDDAFIDNIQLKVFYKELQNSGASGAAGLGLIGTDPTVVSYSSASQTAASVARLSTISKANLQVTATQDLSGRNYTPENNDTRFVGLVDDGTSLWVSVRGDPTHGNLNHRYNKTSFAYESSHDFSATGFFNRGLTWDGTRFWSRSAGAPNLAKHTSWDWTTENPNYWIAYTWYDGTKETIVSPRTQIDLSALRRARLLITVPPFPSGITKARVYVARNATAPATTALHLQAPTSYVDTDSAVSVHEIDFNGSGAAPPTSSGFTTGTPAQIKGAPTAGGITAQLLAGDGTMRPPKGSTSNLAGFTPSGGAGSMGYDTTRGLPVWWNGSVWVATNADLAVTTLAGVTDTNGADISGRVITPGTDTQNGIIVRRPDSGYGSPFVYGDAQAFLLIKEGTGDVHNDLVLARIDGRTGAAGFAGGIHSAGGLHKDVGDATPTQNLWVQNNLDMVGIVVNAFGTTPASSYQLWNDGSGNTKAAVTKDGVIGAYAADSSYGSLYVSSPASGSAATMTLGRGGASVESTLGVASAANQYLTGSSAGDLVLRTITGVLLVGVQGTVILTASATTLFSGVPLAMSSNKITGLAAGTAGSTDAARMVDIPSGATYFPVLGYGAATGTAPVANTIYFGRVLVENKATLTGIFVWNAGAVSGNVRVALYDSAGNRVADRTTNVAQAGTNAVQKIPFDSTYVAVPGVYYAALMFDNTTARFFTLTGGLAPNGSSTNASFVTPGTITVPTAPAATCPVIGTY